MFLNVLQSICGWDILPSCYLCFGRLTQVFSVWMWQNMTASCIWMKSCYKRVEQEWWDVWSHTEAHVSLVAHCGFAVAISCVLDLCSLHLSILVSSLSRLISYSCISFYLSLFSGLTSRLLTHRLYSHLLCLFSFSLISACLSSLFKSSLFSFSFLLFILSSRLFYSSLVSCLSLGVSLWRF